MTEQTFAFGSRIVGDIEFNSATLDDPVIEVPMVTLDWRSALDVFLRVDDIDATGAQMAGLLTGITTRVYAVNDSTKSLLSQNCTVQGQLGSRIAPAADYLGTPWNRFPIPVARVRATGAQKLQITLQGSALKGGALAAPGFRMRIGYVAWGCEATPFDVDPNTTWLPRLNDVTNIVLPGAGRLHQIFAVNNGATDAWLRLIDYGNQDYRATIAPAFPAFPPWFTIIPPVWIPPNGKGMASLDFGRRGLWTRYGLACLATTNNTLPGPNTLAADVCFMAEVS